MPYKFKDLVTEDRLITKTKTNLVAGSDYICATIYFYKDYFIIESFGNAQKIKYNKELLAVESHFGMTYMTVIFEPEIIAITVNKKQLEIFKQLIG